MDILSPDTDRFVLFPLKSKAVWDAYKRSQACFWTAEELDMTQDLNDFESLSDGERHFIELTLAFFAASDGIVNENLASNFMKEVTLPEARCFYGFQIMMENVHSESYSLLIETFVKDPQRKADLFKGIATFPSIGAKADWALKWLDPQRASFGQRLVAFACVEGISFSSAFASIFYMKKRGLMMNGLGKSNEFIARDEGQHRDFAVLLFNMLLPHQRPDAATVTRIVRECVDVETLFVRESLPVALIGMNADAMVEYVQFVADSLLTALGVSKAYGTQNPFDWMETISLQGKTNFFEARVSEYSLANVGQDASQRAFALDADF